MLTKRALLNSIQLFVDQIARIVVSFFLTPLLVMHLGSVGFGLWQIIQKSSLQLASLDGRAPEVLKWVIAGQQNSDDTAKKQRAIGSAITSFLIYTPLLLLVFILFVIYFPSFIQIAPEEIFDTRCAVALLGVSAYLLVIAMMFEATIRGSNIAYKLVGVQAVVLLAGGALSAYAVINNHGLLGLSFAQVVVSILFIICYYYVAKKNIIWLGIKRPTLEEVKESFHRCKWYTLWAFISMWMLTGDIIMLGIFTDSEVVSQYVLTMYISQVITVVILTTVSSILPGLAGIIGEGDKSRAQSLRQESFLYSWWLALSICGAIIVLNQSFVNLWVGSEFYTGNNINILITVSVMQLVLIRHDANILNMALDIRKKVSYGAMSLIISLALMLILIPKYEIVGLCIALLVSRLILQISYPLIIDGFLDVKDKKYHFRGILTTVLILCVCWILSEYIYTSEWLYLSLISVMIFIFILVFVYTFGMNLHQKTSVNNRIKLLNGLLS